MVKPPIGVLSSAARIRFANLLPAPSCGWRGVPAVQICVVSYSTVIAIGTLVSQSSHGRIHIPFMAVEPERCLLSGKLELLRSEAGRSCRSEPAGGNS